MTLIKEGSLQLSVDGFFRTSPKPSVLPLQDGNAGILE